MPPNCALKKANTTLCEFHLHKRKCIKKQIIVSMEVTAGSYLRSQFKGKYFKEMIILYVDLAKKK